MTDIFSQAGNHPLIFIILIGLGIATLSIFLLILALMIMALVSVILEPSIIFNWFKKWLRRFLVWVREVEKQE